MKTLLIILTLTVPIFSQSVIRFAWLSDIHIGYPTAEEDLRISVNDINNFDDIDFTLISGDITAIGSLKELTIAKSILDELNMPYYIIPGNHDTKWSESGSTDFLKLWGNDRFIFEYGKYLFIGLHQGPRMRMADGFWAPEDIRWLDSILSSLNDSNQPLFFITHYPLDEGIANWYEVLDRLKNLNTQAVLVGHGHRNRIYDFESIAGIMGRANIRNNDVPAGYNIGEIKADTLYLFERVPHKSSNLWHYLPLKQRNYEANLGELKRPDYSVNEKYPNVKEIWSFNTGYTIGSSAIVYSNNIFFGDASGKFYSFELNNGNINWTFQTNGPIYSTASISSNHLVFGSADSLIYCLNAETGQLIWSYKTEAAVLGCPVIENNTIYIGSSDRIFRALNLSNGSLLWQFDGLNGFVETKPLIYEDKILFGAWDEHFYCLDKNTGELIWKWKEGRSGVLYSPAVCWAVASEGAVFIVAPDRVTSAIEIYSGKTLWRTDHYQVRETIGISEDGKQIYLRTMNDTILALPLAQRLSEPLWTTNANFGYEISSAQITEKNGLIFFPTKTGEIFALNKYSGNIEWIHKVSSGYLNTITPVSGNKIISTGFDGMMKLISY